MCEEDLVEVQGEGSLVISESERAKRGQKNARGAPCNETFVLIIVTRLMSADKSPGFFSRSRPCVRISEGLVLFSDVTREHINTKWSLGT